jgi:hypothetical protein
VGPGFPNDGIRTDQGDHRQGPVLLVLLSDCESGWGGTAFVPGSHLPVLDALKEAGEAGIAHEDLNEVFKRRMRALTEQGRVRIDPSEKVLDGELAVIQATGKTGDVLLLHPLVVHSGTTNCSRGTVRVMANGMARLIRRDGDGGDPVLRRTEGFRERAEAENGGAKALTERWEEQEDPKEAGHREREAEKQADRDRRGRIKAERDQKKKEKQARQKQAAS